MRLVSYYLLYNNIWHIAYVNIHSDVYNFDKYNKPLFID
jgi:hypothetical protein